MSQFSMATVTHWEISSIQINLTKLHLTLISLSLSLSINLCLCQFVLLLGNTLSRGPTEDSYAANS